MSSILPKAGCGNITFTCSQAKCSSPSGFTAKTLTEFLTSFCSHSVGACVCSGSHSKNKLHDHKSTIPLTQLHFIIKRIFTTFRYARSLPSAFCMAANWIWSRSKYGAGNFILIQSNWGTLLVAQLVEVPLYKPEGRGFDFRWCRNFSLT